MVGELREIGRPALEVAGNDFPRDVEHFADIRAAVVGKAEHAQKFEMKNRVGAELRHGESRLSWRPTWTQGALEM